MDEVTDASILQLTDAEPSALVSQLTASQSKPTIWVAALVVAILVALLALAVTPLLGLILGAAFGFGVWWLRQWDIARRAVVVYFDVNDTHADRFQELVDGFRSVVGCARALQVVARGNTNLYQYKVNAGASNIAQTTEARASMAGPRVLVTNVEVPSLESGNLALYFLPDRILFKQLADSFVASQTRLVEWQQETRNLRVTPRYHKLIEITAHLADKPIEEIDEFAAHLISEIEVLPSKLRSDGSQHVNIDLNLTLTMDQVVVDELGRELNRLKEAS
jgi:hypothetical protein